MKTYEYCSAYISIVNSYETSYSNVHRYWTLIGFSVDEDSLFIHSNSSQIIDELSLMNFLGSFGWKCISKDPFHDSTLLFEREQE